MLILESFLGLIIGLLLGLLGGGGSILTVPALVYLVGQTPQVAVTASLVIVGSNSVSGALFHRAQGTLNWRVALVFGGVGMVFAYVSAGISKQFSPTLLMVLFALLMLTVGTVMIFRKSPEATTVTERNWRTVIASGAGVGLLTGFLGVGGGFLIVPSLVMLVGLPMQQAVGTSLVVIAMNSMAGFVGHLDGFTLDFPVLATFVLWGFVGSFFGVRLGKFFAPEQLRRLFAVFVMVLAVFILVDNLSKMVA